MKAAVSGPNAERELHAACVERFNVNRSRICDTRVYGDRYQIGTIGRWRANYLIPRDFVIMINNLYQTMREIVNNTCSINY